MRRRTENWSLNWGNCRRHISAKCRGKRGGGDGIGEDEEREGKRKGEREGRENSKEGDRGREAEEEDRRGVGRERVEKRCGKEKGYMYIFYPTNNMLLILKVLDILPCIYMYKLAYYIYFHAE